MGVTGSHRTGVNMDFTPYSPPGPLPTFPEGIATQTLLAGAIVPPAPKPRTVASPVAGPLFWAHRA